MKNFQSLAKKYEDKYWKDFKSFVNKHFNEEYVLQNKKFFKWQYMDNPYNFYQSAAMILLIHGDKFLGYLGLIPATLKVFDKEAKKKEAVLCNLMIDESCRGLGIQLIHEAMKDAKAIWATSL